MRTMVVTALIVIVFPGCGMGPEYTAQTVCPPPTGCPNYGVPVPVQQQPAVPVQPVVAAHANPVLIPIADPHYAWEQIVDVVDDYFRIEHEEPVRVDGAMATEGSITTVPEVSPTIFEPWRRDTADAGQRIENTLQSMRRRAVVRVIPAQGGYMVDVQVYKDLEDNKHPARSTAGSATFRYDDTLTRVENPIAGEPTTKGWISQGRDGSLEQAIIGELLCRSGQAGRPVVVRGQDAGR
jgi:hypothetical protein